MAEIVLLIDRDVETLRRLGSHLEGLGMEVVRELDPAAALDAAERLDPDVVVLDLDLPRDGMLEQLIASGSRIIGLVPQGNADAVLAGYRDGVHRVVERPVDPERLGLEIKVAAATAQAAGAARLVTSVAVGVEGLGTHPPMKAVGQQLVNIAQSDRTSVLVTGEPGVGKSWVTRLIHELGPRQGRPFLEVPTVGVDPIALEVSLFGAERWSRAGVDRRRRGRLELAGDGSVVIREVGALPIEFQPLLLRVLEAKSFRRVGGDRDLQAGARVFTTSSRDLSTLVEEGKLNGDLYYRMSALVLHIPPVRERSEADRRAIITTVLDTIVPTLPAPPPPMSPEAMDRLVSHPWPGNVREIRQVLQRVCLITGGQPAILVEHLPGELRARPGIGDRRHNPMSLEEVEKRQIESALRFHGGNRTRAAKELRISRATLINKIKRYAITE